ncbi:MAG: prenyltransferase [Candidatus Omnitrophica bacterium]|nr:prenyltransferase [Candidatus Omnitrophota bacterium]
MNNYLRALRLPFITASILPFIFGSLIDRSHFDYAGFIFGLLAAVSTHFGANLINDYADSKSGADWQDKRFFGFFGGTKLIQEGVFSEKFYLIQSIIYFSLAFISVIFLALIKSSFLPVLCFLVIVLLGFSYSQKPFQFAYNRLGEFIIFLLFGPALVMGAYYIQTNIFPDLKSFMLSLPFGLLITAILFANEVPDFDADQSVRKMTWVSIVGRKNAYKLYLAMIFTALILIVLNVYMKNLAWLSLAVLIFSFIPLKSAKIIKENFDKKEALVESSKLTIVFQNISGLILILALI